MKAAKSEIIQTSSSAQKIGKMRDIKQSLKKLMSKIDH